MKGCDLSLGSYEICFSAKFFLNSGYEFRCDFIF